MKYMISSLLALTVLEIVTLLLAGKVMGIGGTLVLVLGTGILGVLLAKKQGIETLRKAQEQMKYGEVPGAEIVEGICILLGGLFLLLPGLVSDLIGLLLVLPFTRSLIKPVIFRYIRNRMHRMNRGKVTIIR
ncbi:FxsA family protein [Bacillus cihuensis]|uniref:FxsA family protein n=1 Tax=Bacillus cihuensis TaxID=1208599 RepID=UPI0003F7E8CF|nr:FxsA family protein [Bacillus cihuensis]